MRFSSLYLLFMTLHILYNISVKGMGLDFIEEPSSQNVSVGINATFNCTVYSTGYLWLVNGDLSDSSKNQKRGLVTHDTVVDDEENLKIHLLTVPGTMANDGVTVQCYIYSNSKSKLSKTSVLHVQGILESVSNLSAVWINSTAIKITFDPPLTLDGVPIKNYTIELLRDGDKANESSSYTTTETEHVIDGLDQSNNYTVTVSAWNSVGEGNESTFVIEATNNHLAKDVYVISISSTIDNQVTVHPTAVTLHSSSGTIMIGSVISLLAETTTTNSLSQQARVTATTTHAVDPPTSDPITTSAIIWMPASIIALCIFSTCMVTLSVFLVIRVMKYKRKNSKLKIAEMHARQQQRNAEVVLNSITGSRTGTIPIVDTLNRGFVPGAELNGYYEPSPPMPITSAVNPQYESLNSVQQTVIMNNSSEPLQMMSCPAYASLPTATNKPPFV